MAMKIKFVKRGGAVAASITEDDLAAHAPGGQGPDPLPISRMDDLEIPIEVDITYLNPAIDYQPNTQRSQRMTGAGVGIMSLNLPLSLSDSKAKQVADVNLFTRWISRTTFLAWLSRKWSWLESTDVINITKSGVTYPMRITKKDDAIPGISSLEAVYEDTTIYTQSGNAAAAGNIPVQTINIPVNTYIEFIDTHLFRDADNDAGFYVAACGYRPEGWNGCVLYKSIDGGLSYSTVTSITDSTTMGSALTALGNFSSGNIFDESNSVNVQLLGGTLSSATELEVLNGSNYAMLGNEVIQYKNAVLVSTGIYKLTGLLRGRKGTEAAMTTHAIGDRFIVASVSTWQRIDAATSEIGLQRYYKAVTIGMTQQQTPSKTFTNNAEGLECLSPVLPGGGVNTISDIRLSWTRRGRIAGEWRDYVDVPIGETSESYEVDILTSDFLTVKRSITGLSSPVATYTAAQQTTDFGFLLANVAIKVYQLSSVVGRGNPLTSNVRIKNNPVSTQWRVYSTSKSAAGNFLSFREIEMRETVGGADQCNGGTATADSNNGSPTYIPDNAFDNSNVTQWTSANSVFPHWIQYTFASAVSVGQLSLRIAAASEAPLAWQLQYFDGTNWVAVYVQTNEPAWTDAEVRLYTI